MADEGMQDKSYAVVGATENKDKWGWKILKSLKDAGLEVFPVNPKYDEIDGMACYKDLDSIPKIPSMVITVVPPKVTLEVLTKCSELGIKQVWMQPGSESEEAIEFCNKNDIKATYNACFVVDILGGF